MPITKKQLNLVISQARSVIPDFQYRIGMTRKLALSSEAYYDTSVDKIFFKKTYPTRSYFARVLFHELGHWCMEPNKNRAGGVENKYIPFLPLVEEIIVEKVSRALCKKFKYKTKKYHTDYISDCQKELEKQFVSKRDFKECLKYCDKKADQIIEFLERKYKIG